MTGPEIEATFFSPFHFFTYLFVILVTMVGYYQWRWADICAKNVQVLVAQQGGGGDYFLAPKAGGEVTIEDPSTGTKRTWPINELATIDIPYPGVGFVPKFMQKTIRLAIVNEGDWEPLLNRSPHMRKVASPDMIEAFESIAEEADDKIKKAINAVLEGVSTSPTRAMIASPAALGNLIHEKITEAVSAVAKDILNPLNEAVKKLGQRLNPLYVYILLGLIVVMVGYMIFQVGPSLEGLGDMVEDINKIKTSLGVQ